jgi:hypothetical protein
MTVYLKLMGQALDVQDPTGSLYVDSISGCPLCPINKKRLSIEEIHKIFLCFFPLTSGLK